MDRCRDILDFWFGPADAPDYDTPKEMWFRGGPEVDATIRDRFLAEVEAAASGGLDHWVAKPEDCIALVLLLDQFPRNLFRNTPRAFAADSRARAVAMAALDADFDQGRAYVERVFLYMPFEHSEDIADQHRAVALFEGMPDHPARQEWIDYAVSHCRIIERFGRFPHRNEILGRESTPEEIAWLEDGGERFGTGGKTEAAG
jgi:uncharacterized protein (DUF924 family)